MRTITTSALIITSTLFLAACSSTPETKAPVTDAVSTKDSAPKAVEAPTVATVTPTPAKPVELNLVPGKRSVYFDYDSFDLKTEYSAQIEAHAKYLVKNPNRKAIVEGNADERGGSEYNLALGQKRAEAERKALELLGVPSDQLEAVSFGKEKPRSSGHDEASWADNRRADIVYQTK